MGNFITIKSVVSAGVFFILGISTAILYNQYDLYKWQLKFDVYNAIHTLEQIHNKGNYDDAMLQLRKNVACEVENYVKRNAEIGFDVDQAFVDATLQRVQVTCD